MDIQPDGQLGAFDRRSGLRQCVEEHADHPDHSEVVPAMIALATVLAVLLHSPATQGKGPLSLRLLCTRRCRRSGLCRRFRLMFNYEFGIVNKMLAGIGLPQVSWFSNPNAAMALLMIALTWRWAGYNAILILAGLNPYPRICTRRQRSTGCRKPGNFCSSPCPCFDRSSCFAWSCRSSAPCSSFPNHS